MLAQVLRPMAEMFPAGADADVIVGLGAADDAAVYRLGGGRIGVFTVDFFPPVVDSARDFGAIAAANSLSDVWAMGADPVIALNLAMFPSDMPEAIVAEIFAGVAEVVREAGAVIAGGHTMSATEPTFGLAAFGIADEGDLMTKGGLAPGQQLVLTKPLGTGILTTAAKQGKMDEAALAPAVAAMRQLNRAAAAAARKHGVRSATDITGFGLLGHALEMAAPSGVGLRLDAVRIPWLDGVERWIAAGVLTGGGRRNARYYGERVRWSGGVADWIRVGLADPQTSGGLLLAVAADRLDALLTELRAAYPAVAHIGEVVAGAGIEVVG